MPVAINASGTVTGSAKNIDHWNNAFIFSNGTIQNIGTLAVDIENTMTVEDVITLISVIKNELHFNRIVLYYGDILLKKRLQISTYRIKDGDNLRLCLKGQQKCCTIF